jgi:hypothetical protein
MDMGEANACVHHTDDPTVLPLPNHVMLNHLYFKKHEDDDKRDILILGTTQRYKVRAVRGGGGW